MNLIGALQRNSFINAAVKLARVNVLVDWLLRLFPKKRRTSSGIVYRVDSVPSWVVANEVFKTDVYARAIELVKPRTFIDLGANVGYFPLLVSHLVQSREICGLLVEPNPELHALIERHLRENGLGNVFLLKGLAGDAALREAEFFLNPSHIASGVSPNFNPNVPVAGKVRRIMVPVFDLYEQWQRSCPGKRIEIMKIDIEGAEIGFMKSHAAVLALTDAILIEWHKWVTSLDEVSALLGAAGFKLEFISQEDRHAGTAFFRRGARA